MLELSSHKKALDSLQESLDCSAGNRFVPESIIRDSVIQRFEYSYELAWKLMKHWLEINLGRPYIDGVSRRELFRLAAEHRLIADQEAWFTFHTARKMKKSKR